MDAVHLLLRNQVEKRAVLENLDCVILCLDETIDDGCVLPPGFFFATRVLMEIYAYEQDHCGDGPDDDRIAGEPPSGRHHGDCYQRADDHERVPDGEGKDAAENRAILAAQFCRSSYGRTSSAHWTHVGEL